MGVICEVALEAGALGDCLIVWNGPGACATGLNVAGRSAGGLESGLDGAEIVVAWLAVVSNSFTSVVVGS